VRVPHTWGAANHKAGWYRLRLPLSPAPGRRLYVVFEGVSVYADVYLNGHHLGQHRGAFTRFVFDATEHVVEGENVLAVRANNELLSTADSLPSGTGKQLYNLYGGIYRKAWLVETDALHVDPTDHESSGLYVTPSDVSADSATVSLRVLVRNASDRARRVTVRANVLDALSPEQLEQLYQIAGAVLTRLDPAERLTATSCQFSEGPAAARMG